MPQFAYSAIDHQGMTVQGSLNADDMIDAADLVRRLGYRPTKVEQVFGEDTTVAIETQEPQQPGAGYSSEEDLDRTAPIYQPYVGSLLNPPDSHETDTEERLEPWQRGGPVPQPPAPAFTAVAPNVAPTQTMSSATLASPPPRIEVGPVREGAGRGTGKSAGFGQRFVEAFIYPVWSGVVLKDMAPYYRQFATLIDAGLPLYQTLMALEGNTNNKKLKEVTVACQLKVAHGNNLSEAMASFPWVFPQMHIEMIRAAEKGGMLDQVLLQLSDYVEHDLAMRRLISAETFYPKLVLFAALMILGGRFFTDAIPALSRLILGSMGKDSYGSWDYFNDTIGFGLKIAVPIFILVVIFRLYLFHVKGVREAYDSFKTRIPGLGSIVKMFALSKFMRTFAALYKGGFSMSTNLQVSGDACGNSLLQNAARDAVSHVQRGGLVSDYLARSGFFPPVAINMIRTGETTGSMDEMLTKSAEFYEGEAKLKARQLALLFSVAVLLLVGVFVGVAVIKFYGGYAGAVSGGGQG